MTGYMYAYVHVGTHACTHGHTHGHQHTQDSYTKNMVVQRQQQLEVNSILGSVQHPNYDKDESGHQPGSERCHFFLELEGSIRA